MLPPAGGASQGFLGVADKGPLGCSGWQGTGAETSKNRKVEKLKVGERSAFGGLRGGGFVLGLGAAGAGVRGLRWVCFGFVWVCFLGAPSLMIAPVRFFGSARVLFFAHLRLFLSDRGHLLPIAGDMGPAPTVQPSWAVPPAADTAKATKTGTASHVDSDCAPLIRWFALQFTSCLHRCADIARSYNLTGDRWDRLAHSARGEWQAGEPFGRLRASGGAGNGERSIDLTGGGATLATVYYMAGLQPAKVTAGLAALDRALHLHLQLLTPTLILPLEGGGNCCQEDGTAHRAVAPGQVVGTANPT